MIYKVKSFVNFQITRDIFLENIETGTIDVTFDDDEDKFDFLNVGETYSCKITLLGNIVDVNDERAVYCRILEKDVMIGVDYYTKILIEEDIYYYYTEEADKVYLNEKDEFYIKYSRKDLAEVEGKISWRYTV